jgi:hypothetical protein
MPGNINEFKASFKVDPAKSSKFDVLIPVPLTMVQYLNIGQKLSFRCENAELPGRTLVTTEQKTYGPTEKHPYMTTYNDINLTFIVSDDMSEKQFFDAWMEIINPSTNYNFKYRGDYVTTVTINQYDSVNQKSYSVDLIDAYPIAVNQLDLDWSSEATHKLVVVFAYTSCINNSVQSVVNSAIDTGIGGIINQITGSSGLGGGLR